MIDSVRDASRGRVFILYTGGMNMAAGDEKVDAALGWILRVFKKHGVPYQVCGGFAAHLYGATRPINDIDIDIPRDAFQMIHA